MAARPIDYSAPPARAESAPATPGKLRRRLLLLGVLVLIALIIADLAIYKPLQGPTAPAGRNPAPLPLADINPVGTNVFLHKEVDAVKKDTTISLLSEAGFSWIKQEFPWSEIEISDRGDYFDDTNQKVSWAKFDDIVQRANRAGLKIIARLDRSPGWARQGLVGDNPPPNDFADFANFVNTFVARYKGRVQAIQVWNEPNLVREWLADQPADPEGYAALLKASYIAAKAADPNIIVLSAPLATTNEEDFNLRETIYLERVYQELERLYQGDGDCRHCFDVASANGFGKWSPPEEPPSTEVLNFRRVELLRQVMEQYGDSAKPIWFTEYGWNASPTTLAQSEQDIWGRVSQVEQAEYTVRGIEYARQNWPWAGVFTVWYFRHVGDIASSKAEYYFGMVTPEFVREPIYYSIRNLATGLDIAGAGLYGVLSAPVQADAGWSINLRENEEDGAPTPLLVSNSTTATLTLQFEGTEVAVDIRTLGQNADGTPGRLYVTVDGGVEGVAAELPRDEAGRPYIDAATIAAGVGTKMAAPAGVPQVVSLVSSFGRTRPPELHRIELKATASGIEIAGFEVKSERSLTEFWLVTGGLLLALVVDLALLRKWRGG